MESITQPQQLSFDTPHLCECGCGRPVRISEHGDKYHGYARGIPRRFLPGHNRKVSIDVRIAAFWDKMDKSGDCWLWTSNRLTNGYGQFTIKGRSKSPILTHRFAYELTYGPIPKGMHVCHKCDVKLCCNPDHLFLGTPADNANDCVRKGRRVCKLTMEQIENIYREYQESDIPFAALARKYGVSYPTIIRHVRRREYQIHQALLRAKE